MEHFLKVFIELLFSCSLFFNAILFIPQALKILKNKHTEGVSITTFIGFNIIQIFTILHSFIVKDNILLIGYIASFLTCGYVTFLILKFK